MATKDFIDKNTLLLTPQEVMEMYGISWSAARRIQRQTAAQFAPPIRKASELETDLMSSGFSDLDQKLGKVFLVGNVTEIAGPAGSGKTQLCLELLASAAADSLKSNSEGVVAAILIDTEMKFNASRLLEIMRKRCPFVGDSQEAMTRVLVAQEILPAHFLRRIESLRLLLEAGQAPGCRLLVVDSLASLARRFYFDFCAPDPPPAVQRAQFFYSIVSSLRSLAVRHQLCVVLTNQITTVYQQLEFDIYDTAKHLRKEETEQQRRQHIKDKQLPAGYLIPALGASWRHFPNTRLFLQFLVDTSSNQRELIVAKSPVSSNRSVVLSIESAGLRFHGETVEELSASVQDCALLARNAIPG